jgi:dCMP deaminase
MRISFEKMAMEFASSAAKRSEDPYKKVGCSILNQEGRVLSIGYNGLLSKQKINKKFWDNRDDRRKYMLHAETNALACISRYENPYLIACTLMPCPSCAINIASHGIKKVIYLEDYNTADSSETIFNFYKIQLIKYNI